MERKVFWSKESGRGDCRYGSTVNLVNRTYSDALGNVLRRLMEKDHSVLFGSQEDFDRYVNVAVKRATLDIEQEKPFECPESEVGHLPEPYLNMVSDSWVNDSPLVERDKKILRLHLEGYTQAEIGAKVNLPQKAISRRLRSLAGKLRDYMPDELIEGRPCSFGAYTERAKVYPRIKREYVAWVKGKGKTLNQYVNLTKRTICFNLVGMSSIKGNSVGSDKPQSGVFAPVKRDAKTLGSDSPCQAIAERLALRVQPWCSQANLERIK